VPEPVREHRFHPTRRWRIDFCWPLHMLAVECEGGIYRGGGHTSVGGMKRDFEKGNALTLAGYRLLRFHGDQVRSGEATETIRQALEIAPAEQARDGRALVPRAGGDEEGVSDA
jgi:very-short-patch-repair endonuclease